MPNADSRNRLLQRMSCNPDFMIEIEAIAAV
jgi:hypothetical protein